MIFKKILICAVCTAILTGCEKRSISSVTENYSDRNIFAMDTFMTIRAYGDNGDEALKSAEQRIKYLESVFSVTAENSDIHRINVSDGSEAEVSEETAELLSQAVRLGNETDGALDITLYPVLNAWGFTADEFRIPDSDEISELLEYVDYSEISVDGKEFVSVGKVDLHQSVPRKEIATRDLVTIFDKTEARYVRVFVKNNDATPEWSHVPGFSPSYMFLDHITVE